MKTRQPKKNLEGLTPLAVRHIGEPALAFVNRAGARLDANGRRVKPKDPYFTGGRPKGLYPEASVRNLSKRHETYLGTERNPHNPRPCQKVLASGIRCGGKAIRDCKFCRWHGGRVVLEQKLRARFRDYRPQAGNLAKKELRSAKRMGQIPGAMWTHRAFAAVYFFSFRGVTRFNPRFSDSSCGERRLFVENCCLLALAFIAAWERLETAGEFEPWAECNRKASLLGLTDGLNADDQTPVTDLKARFLSEKPKICIT